MTRPLRYGLIGAGMMGREHLRNIALIDDVTVIAIAEPDADMRARAQSLCGARVQMHRDYRRLLERDDLDALIIASPNFTHKAILADVMAVREIAILVEKPVCTSLEDCFALQDMSQGYGAPLWVAMEYRYMPPVERLIGAAHGGEAGQLHMVAIREHRFPFLPKVGDWNRFARYTGGTMVEKCCHFFDLMRLITGSEPQWVFADGAQSVNHLQERYGGEVPDILDNAFVTVGFRHDMRAMLDLCMFAEGAQWQEEITVVGDKAKIACLVPPAGSMESSALHISRRAPIAVETHEITVDEALLRAGHHHGSTYYQHVHFSAAVRGQGPVSVTLQDGLRAVVMGLAAERSIAEGRKIDLREMGRGLFDHGD